MSGQILALFGALSYSLTQVFIRKGLEYGDTDKYVGMFVTIFVNNIINIFIAAYIVLFSRPAVAINIQAVFYFILAGGFSIVFGRVFLFQGIEKIGAARVAPFKITAPLFAVLLGVLFLREQLALISYIGIALTLIGVMFVSYDVQSIMSHGKNNFSVLKNLNSSECKTITRMGIVFALFSGFSFGVGNVFRKVGVGYFPYPLVGLIIGSLFSLFCILAVLIYQRKFTLEIFKLFKEKSGIYYVLAGVCSNFGMLFVFLSYQFIPVSLSMSISSSEPIFVLLLTVFLYKNIERVNLRVVIGALLTFAGVILLVR